MANTRIGATEVRGDIPNFTRNAKEQIVFNRLSGKTHIVEFTDTWDAAKARDFRADEADPDFPNELKLSDAVAVRDDDMANIRLVYSPPKNEGGSVDESVPVPEDEIYEDPAIETVPISQHPKFVSHLAGTPDAPLNGAKFDDDGLFIGFDAGSDYAGVDSFYVGGRSITVVEYFRARPSALDGPVIADPPNENSSGRFLRMPSAINRSGQFFSRRTVYNYSTVPWDDVIYD